MGSWLRLGKVLLTAVLGVLSLLPHGLLGNPAVEDEDVGWSSALGRVKRGWELKYIVHRVLEGNTGLEPRFIIKLGSNMDKGDGSIKYTLTGEGAGTTFTINDSTGEIYAIQDLKWETKAQYVLNIQARTRLCDRLLEPETVLVIIIEDINDNPPRFLDGPYCATVPEMSPIGTSVIQVRATDADSPASGSVVYSILEGQPYFSVDANTGVLRVSLADMDRETREKYSVVIQAKDMDGQLWGLTGTTTVNVMLSDINDNPPTFAQRFYRTSLPETAHVRWVVCRIEAKDRDIGINAEMSYSIIGGDGRDTFDIYTDHTNTFGIITVKRPLDFETKLSYTLKVEGANTHVDPHVHHRGPFKDVAIVHVDVEDVDEPPLFDSAVYNVELPEDAEIGTVVKTVSARDPDSAKNTVRYSIVRTSDLDKYFYINTTSGALMTARTLDREEMSWHNITVLATEMSNLSQIASVSVAIKITDVNDNPPSLMQYLEAYMCENATAGQLIKMVTAVDADEPQGGQNFYYSLAPEMANNPYFTLINNQDNTAWILTRHGGWLQQQQAVFHLPIVVSDGEHSSSSMLTISVCSCDHQGNLQSCTADAYSRSFSFSRVALMIVILAGSFALLVLILLMLSLRSRRKKTYQCDGEENVQNIVPYNNEGGGKQDTKAFDITAVWNLGKMRQGMLPGIESLSDYVPQDYVHCSCSKKDSSVAESLSWPQSGTSNTEHKYDCLNDLGPHFRKLAEMYGILEPNSPPLG